MPLAERAHGLSQRDRGVVGGDGQQRGEQVGDPVPAPGDQAGHRSARPRSPACVARTMAAGFRLRYQGDRRQHLQRARRAELAVRVPGGEHLPGAGVGDHEGGGRNGRQPGRRLGRIVHHGAGRRHQRPANEAGEIARGVRGRGAMAAGSGTAARQASAPVAASAAVSRVLGLIKSHNLCQCARPRAPFAVDRAGPPRAGVQLMWVLL